MAFRMINPPYGMDNTPIYSTDMDDNILGMAQSNGSILVNKNISPLELKKSKTIEHEMVHIDQMKRGDLDYTDTHVMWKGKKYLRSKMNEGAKNLPWEKEAYTKQNNKQTKENKMAYKQNAGRGNSPKTGNGLPSVLMQKDPKKPDFKGSTDKGEMGGGYLGEPNTDLLKVAKYYGGKVIDKVKQGGQYLSDLAEGKKGSSSYSDGDESMRQKNMAKKKAPAKMKKY